MTDVVRSESGPAIEAPVITEALFDQSAGDVVFRVQGTGVPGAVVEFRSTDPELPWREFRIPVLADGRLIINENVLANGMAASVAAEVRQRSDGVFSPAVAVRLTQDPPVVTSPSDGDLIYTPGSSPVTGTALGGSTITLRIDGAVRGSTVADSRGQWSVGLPADLRGRVVLRVTQQWGRLESVSAPVGVTAGISAPPAVRVALMRQQPGGTSLEYHFEGIGTAGAVIAFQPPGPAQTVVVGEDGTWTLTAATDDLQDRPLYAYQSKDGDASGDALVHVNLDAPRLDVAEWAQTGSRRVLSGTGLKGAAVVVSVAGVAAGQATVAEDGTWTVTAPTDLPAGEQKVMIQQSLGGRYSAASPYAFIGLDAPGIAVALIRHRYEDDSVEYHLQGSGYPGASIQYRGTGQGLGWTDRGTVADEHGAWSFGSIYGGSDTTVEMEVRQSSAGLVSASTVVGLALDTPEITVPGEDPITEPRPQIEGRGIKGSTVTLTVDGTVYGTTTVGDRGTWTLTPDHDLPGGLRTLSVTQTLRGLTSPAHTRETTVTGVFGIQQPEAGAHTGPMPVLTGTGKSG
ncbi:Ig-like domain-containing protein, partial [Streptomyces lavendulae]|uniref:Ig-like domain-containing protein n=1 Tax=Streptomyces lavendulae TaxID=1914 RepID=UPI0033D35ED8